MIPEFSIQTIIKILSLLLEIYLGQLMLCKILTPKAFRLRIPCMAGIFVSMRFFFWWKSMFCLNCMVMFSGSM